MVALSLIGSLLLTLAPQAESQAWMGVALPGDGDSRGPGVEVAEVFEGSPAEVAGLHAGDRVMSIDGRPLGNQEELLARLRRERPGARRHLWVRRDVRVHLDPSHVEGERPLLGVMLAPGQYEGMLTVTEVVGRSPAARAGLRAGDQLRTVEGQGTPTVARLKQRMARSGLDGSVVVGISRRLEIEFGARPGEQGQPQSGRRDEHRPHGRVERRLQDIEAARERGRSGEWTPDRRAPRSEHSGERRGEDGHGLSPDHNRVYPMAPPAQTLERELRELSEGMRELRRELAGLRHELRELRERR